MFQLQGAQLVVREWEKGRFFNSGKVGYVYTQLVYSFLRHRQVLSVTLQNLTFTDTAPRENLH